MIEVGALALVILVLAISTLLLRRRRASRPEERYARRWFLADGTRSGHRVRSHAAANGLHRRQYVRVLHGSILRFHDELYRLAGGDWIHFTDWHGDPDEQLDGSGTR